ncbi:hypothetical protein PybrP1_001088 [[Pythium] brassicae (nom. inval.)]|nr:hypothetical protein PybrP1_001088 [[Pythium] brassicae (nom. inval.)]
MGMAVTGSKRKRQAAAAVRSELDKFAHKSGVLLQREAKKVRAFLVRKGVQQLKQTRAQLEQRRKDDASSAPAAAVNGVTKLTATVQRLEREHAALKALDLRVVVARVVAVTGLEKRQQERQQQQQQHGVRSDEDGSDSDDEGDGWRGGEGGGGDVSDGDDGFDSEEYENARRGGAQQGNGDDSESDEDADSADEEQQEMSAPQKTGGKSSQTQPKTNVGEEEEETAGSKKPSVDERLQNIFIDRILAHKQMKPLVDAIAKWLENEEREHEKKLRRQEKKALKRGSKEVLIGGRSAAAPSSLFLGSLSGRGGADALGDDEFGMPSSHMAGAEDDIAEFLGEKKKKNRSGQNARRQKAMRLEEAARRKQERENGIFRPYAGARRDDTVSKYGPSERPKKKKPAPEGKGGGKRSGAGGRADKKDALRKRGESSGGRERERGAPAVRVASSSAVAVEVAHPSWIAKQALKEKEKASLGAFSGKKITFD